MHLEEYFISIYRNTLHANPDDKKKKIKKKDRQHQAKIKKKKIKLVMILVGQDLGEGD